MKFQAKILPNPLGKSILVRNTPICNVIQLHNLMHISYDTPSSISVVTKILCKYRQ